MEIDSDTMEPKSELSSAALDWCKENGIKGKTIEDVMNGSDFARSGHDFDFLVPNGCFR